jgi:NADH:ubiquinone oxidoreductase subunit K
LTALSTVTRKEKQTVRSKAKLLVLPKDCLMVPMMENPMDQAMGPRMVHLMEINWVYLMATETVIGMACLMVYYLVRPRENPKETLMGAPTAQRTVSQMVLLSNSGLVLPNLAVWVCPREIRTEHLTALSTVTRKEKQTVQLSNSGLVLPNLAVWVCPRAIRTEHLTALSTVTRKEKQTGHSKAKLLVLPKDCLMVPMMENPMDQAMGPQMVHLMKINWVYLMATETVIGMACLMGYYLVRPRENPKETLMGAQTAQRTVSQMVLLRNSGLVLPNLAVWVCPRAIRTEHLTALSTMTRKEKQTGH